ATLRDGTDAVLPLVRLKPGDRPLGRVLVACLSEAGARAGDGQRGASTEARRAERAVAAIAARCAEPDLDAAVIASEVRLTPRRLGKLLHAHGRGGFRTLLREASTAAIE